MIEPSKKVTDSVKKKMERLAHTFKKPRVWQQFNSMLEFARREMQEFGCTVHEAWMNVVLKRRQMQRSDALHDLFFVLKRLQTYVPCTSKIEQTFSILDKTFGSHRLNMSPAMENMSVSLLVNRHTGDADRSA